MYPKGLSGNHTLLETHLDMKVLMGTQSINGGFSMMFRNHTEDATEKKLVVILEPFGEVS